MNHRDEKTLLVPDGTELKVAVSALIKDLRRGREIEARYWAGQIETRYWRYLWRRLAIFAAEDIGLADPQAVTLVASLRTLYEIDKKESQAPKPDGSLIGLAVLYLARADKNQEASYIGQAVVHATEDEGWSPSVPEEAYDLHTAQGRDRMPDKATRLRHWLTVASHSEPSTGPMDWTLWILRWAVRRGAMDRAEVEAIAEEWNDQGRLRWGPDGYTPRRRF